MRCPNPRYVWPNGKVIQVPCGKCLACLSNKRHDWTARLMQEYKVSSSAFFLTLTYSDKYYPDCGVVKRHVQLYMKRVRKVTPRLRYYLVAEYGSRTGRGHYHAIVFNAKESVLRSCWSLFDRVKKKEFPIGIVHVGRVTEASCAYVTKYIVQSGGAIDGLNKPFCLMSRGYGLGLNYLTDEMVKWHRNASRVYMIRYGQKVRLPRYYKDKIWPDSSWSDWKFRRQEVLKKSLKEAEESEAKLIYDLSMIGITEPMLTVMRNTEIGRIKRKIAFTQTL